MAMRFISSESASEDLDHLLEQVRDSGEEVVLKVNGRSTAMVVPLNEHAQQEALRESFGRFWDAHKAYLEENPPPDLTEEEVMDEALEIQREIRAQIRAENEAGRVQERDIDEVARTA